MNARDQHETTRRALADLDPAGGRPSTLAGLDPAQRRRAEDTLTRILATDPRGPVDPDPTPRPVPRPVPRTARREARREAWRKRRILLVPAGLVAAATAAVVVTPGVGGGQAYAGWVPTPSPLPVARTAQAAEFCLAAHDLTTSSDTRTLLAERRGDWAYVLVSRGDDQLSCVIPTSGLGEDPDRLVGGYFSSLDTEVAAPRVPADGLEQSTSVLGETDDGLLASTEGSVGRAVVGVSVLLDRGDEVEASLAAGRYAAWWPEGDADDPDDVQAAVEDGFRFRLTLRDGSTRVVRG